MKPAFIVVSCLLFPVAGCGRRDTSGAATKPVAGRSVVAEAGVTWAQSLVEDGSMFRDEATFRDYLKGAEVVAIGTLSSWDGRDGMLRVERVLRGRAGEELALRASGGGVRPKPGRRVIALLSTRDGRMALHSFCAAGGLYTFTEGLAAYVEGTLPRRPL